MVAESLPVKSSAISRIAYDSETGECFFTFHRGGSYIVRITETMARDWAQSASPGLYFNLYIKGNY